MALHGSRVMFTEKLLDQGHSTNFMVTRISSSAIHETF